MTLTPNSTVRLTTGFETITGTYLGTQPGQPGASSRRQRSDKLIIRESTNVIVHVPEDDVTKTEVLP